MSRCRALLVLTALVLAAAACSSGDDTAEDVAGGSGSEDAQTSPDGGPADDPDGETVPLDEWVATVGDACADLAAVSADLESSGGDGEELPDALRELSTAFDDHLAVLDDLGTTEERSDEVAEYRALVTEAQQLFDEAATAAADDPAAAVGLATDALAMVEEIATLGAALGLEDCLGSAAG